ncbi:MAG: M20/M25/M40 family metallo-hydrolase, partial [Pseudomonadota bacterium]
MFLNRMRAIEAEELVTAEESLYIFGDDAIVLSDRSSGVSVEVKGDVRFVKQKGGSFIQDHPEANVLADFGRYLFVEFENIEYDDMNHEHICWAISKPEKRCVVFRTYRQSSERRGLSSESLTESVNKNELQNNLAYLTSYRDRFTIHETYDRAADYCQNYLTNLGLEVSRQVIDMSDTNYPTGPTNVVAKKSGTENSGKKVVIGAHLDSINNVGGRIRPELPAPGADDNASGSCGVLELARIYAQESTKNDLEFVLFGAEEIGLVGSRHYVNQLPDPKDVVFMLNMDMIGGKTRDYVPFGFNELTIKNTKRSLRTILQ